MVELQADPKLSVICSIFNASRYLARYLNSLEQQHLERFKIIFADANSSDRSLQIITEYRPRKGIRKRIIRSKEKMGIYQTWNIAIRNSSGSWLINYNCDDYIFSESLLLLKEVARTNSSHGVIYSPCLVSSSPQHQPITGFSNWNDANAEDNLAKSCCCGPFPMVNRSCYEEHGLFREDFLISGDYEMWCRLHSRGVRMMQLEIPLGIYYVNPHGFSSAPENQSRRMMEDQAARQSLSR